MGREAITNAAIELMTRVAELEAENAILRDECAKGVAMRMKLTEEMKAQRAAHDKRRDLMEQHAQAAAKHVVNVKALGRRLDEVRLERDQMKLAAAAHARDARAAGAPGYDGEPFPYEVPAEKLVETWRAQGHRDPEIDKLLAEEAAIEAGLRNARYITPVSMTLSQGLI
jgi:hypothetical protein